MSIGGWCGTLLCCVALASCTTSGSGRTQFAVEVADAEDQVLYKVEGPTAIFDISSPSGIGSAQVTLVSGPSPSQLLLRFHLQGLEELVFAYDTTAVTASVLSSGEGMVLESVRTAGGAQEEIDADSPYWMNIRFVPAGEQASAAPSQAGYFEVEAPDDFLAGRYRAFSIRWVDFYR